MINGFILVLTFYAWTGNSVAVTSETIPYQYQTIESCNAAAKEAKGNYSGGATLDWACVPKIY